MTRDQYAPTDSDARDVTARYGLIDGNLAKTKDLGNFANGEDSRSVFVGHHSVLSFDKAVGYEVKDASSSSALLVDVIVKPTVKLYHMNAH